MAKAQGQRRAAKTKKRSEQNEEDRLEAALKAKYVDVEIAGRKMRLQKWTLRQGLRMTGKIAKVIRHAMPTGQVSDLLSLDVEGVISDHEDAFIEVLAVSIQRGNFETEQDAAKWLDDEVDIEEALELFVHVGRLNIRPLIKRLAAMKSVIAEDVLASTVEATAPQ